MWWWEFSGEEPLQEDIIVYERFMELRRDRERMNRIKAEQKAQKQQRDAMGGGRSMKYRIPD